MAHTTADTTTTLKVSKQQEGRPRGPNALRLEKEERACARNGVLQKRFWKILGNIVQRYLYPTYKPRCFSLTLAKLDDTGVPFSHPLCSWYPRITAWLAGSGQLDRSTGGGHPVLLLPCPATLAPSVVPRPSALLIWIPSGPAWLRLWSSPLPMASPPTGPAMIF